MEENKTKTEVEETDFEDDDLLDNEDIDNLDEDEDESKKSSEKSKAKKGDEPTEEELAERARQAKLRREREAKEREEHDKQIRDKALLEGELNATKVNSFTNKPIKDEYDLKIYKLQRQIEDEGGDPIADLPERLARIERETATKKQKEVDEKKEQDETIANDIKDFKSKYPNVNLQELLKDPDFKDYSDGRLGIKGGLSLATIYENFTKFKAKYSKSEEKEEGEGEKAKIPSPNGGRKQEQTSYSKMTPKQKEAYLREIGLIR